MTDLKIPNLNKKSDKFFFKKKLTLRRKSKRKLITESFLMTSLSILIIYLNFLIPNKKMIFYNFFNNISNLLARILEGFSYFYEICLAVFILFSLFFVIVLILGVCSRLLKIAKRKTRKISFK